MRRIVIVLLTVWCMTAVSALETDAQPAPGSISLKYKIPPVIHASVVPNYSSGFGPIGGSGSGTTPAAGAGAVLNGGTVDFGNVVAGYGYLYRYAAQVNVTSNDTAGFIVYGEGSSDLNGSNPVPTPATFPLATSLYWLQTNAGNTPYSPAQPFNATTAGTPSGTPFGSQITYAGAYPAGSMVWSYPGAGSASRGYDYELRLSGSIPGSQFNVYIVYTVVGN